MTMTMAGGVGGGPGTWNIYIQLAPENGCFEADLFLLRMAYFRCENVSLSLREGIHVTIYNIYIYIHILAETIQPVERRQPSVEPRF